MTFQLFRVSVLVDISPPPNMNSARVPLTYCYDSRLFQQHLHTNVVASIHYGQLTHFRDGSEPISIRTANRGYLLLVRNFGLWSWSEWWLANYQQNMGISSEFQIALWFVSRSTRVVWPWILGFVRYKRSPTTLVSSAHISLEKPCVRSALESPCYPSLTPVVQAILTNPLKVRVLLNTFALLSITLASGPFFVVFLFTLTMSVL